MVDLTDHEAYRDETGDVRRLDDFLEHAPPAVLIEHAKMCDKLVRQFQNNNADPCTTPSVREQAFKCRKKARELQ